MFKTSKTHQQMEAVGKDRIPRQQFVDLVILVAAKDISEIGFGIAAVLLPAMRPHPVAYT